MTCAPEKYVNVSEEPAASFISENDSSSTCKLKMGGAESSETSAYFTALHDAT
jgi:hypothetical protein